MNIGPTELVIILVVALIVFGPRKLPDLGKSLGHAMAQFRRASDDFKRSWEQEVEIEKTRLGEIKENLGQDLGSGLGFDTAGEDFNYSMDPNRGEAEVASGEASTTENAIEPPMVEPVEASAPVSDAATPEPATATIARNEPWI